MKYIIIFLLCSYNYSFGQQDLTSYEQVASFYQENERLNQQNIEWGLFTVPENWEKLAVAKLKNISNKKNAEAVVMIEGGPGASAIEGIWWWLNHPLRETNDIVLLDVRGTGFSQPRLCPELGKEFLNILSKNQGSLEDEKEKAQAALNCKQSLLAKGIDVNSYHSYSMVQDLHALKKYLKYSSWNVYSVSYGTYVAQLYAKTFPSDVKTLILDSPISNIDQYYTLNTTNYVSSLEKVFNACERDSACALEYPNLESLYRETINNLKEKPITVKVDKATIPAGTFTYNAEDFKIAIHQALYQKRLVEVLPLLIKQFHEKNEDALSALVAAFTGALSLDYGAYYCVTCNEAVPQNPYEAYTKNVQSQNILSQGLSFYKSDFAVCNLWNQNSKLDTTELVSSFEKIKVPTLIMVGGFDPITPSENGDKLLNAFENGQLIKADSYGHASSFSKIGFKTVNDFINDPYRKIEHNFNSIPTDFVEQVFINGGVSNMGNSLNNLDIVFFAPIAIALLILFIAIFAYLYSIFKGKNRSKLNTSIKLSLIISGLPEKYSFIFKLLLPLMVVLLVTKVFHLLFCFLISLL